MSDSKENWEKKQQQPVQHMEQKGKLLVKGVSLQICLQLFG